MRFHIGDRVYSRYFGAGTVIDDDGVRMYVRFDRRTHNKFHVTVPYLSDGRRSLFDMMPEIVPLGDDIPELNIGDEKPLSMRVMEAVAKAIFTVEEQGGDKMDLIIKVSENIMQELRESGNSRHSTGEPKWSRPTST